MKTLFIVTLLIAGMLTTYTQACTRVVYLGKNGMVVTGRTMDWKEDLKPIFTCSPEELKERGRTRGTRFIGNQNMEVSSRRDTTSVLPTG